MAIWMDMTNSLYIWNGGVVGIVRAELEIAKNLHKLDKRVRFCISTDVGIEEVPVDNLQWLWEAESVSDAYLSVKNDKKQRMNEEHQIPIGLAAARNYSEGRLERLRRIGEIGIETLPYGMRQVSRGTFKILFAPIEVSSRLRMSFKRRFEKSDSSDKDKETFNHPFNEGDLLFSCGWYNNNNNKFHSKVKSQLHNFKIVYLIYDLVLAKDEFKPLFQETAEFEHYITWIANNCDYIFYGGNTAKKDSEKYFREHGLPIHKGYAVKFGSEFVKYKGVLDNNAIKKKYGIESEYILAVGSFAPKKNYGTIYKAYTIMAQNKGLKSIPQLVIVGGRYGGAVLADCMEFDPHIEGKIVVISPSDEELDLIYRGCLFTVLPTLYEGWSLTLPESLAYGKFCLCSNVEPLREIAGDMVDYVDAMDPVQWADSIMHLFADRNYLQEKEERIKPQWKNITWKDCGKQVMNYLSEIDKDGSSKKDKTLYYDMTLVWQSAIVGANVSGILRTQLLLARYLSYRFSDMKFCAFTEFGYIALDRFLIADLLTDEDIECAYRHMSRHIQEKYWRLSTKETKNVGPIKVNRVNREAYKEIFWLWCSCMPYKIQKFMINWYENKKEKPYTATNIDIEPKQISFIVPFKTGDLFFSTGVGLGTKAYEDLMEAKQKEQFKFVQLLYDFTPVLYPHLHQKQTCENYYPFLKYTYKMSDFVFYGGHTALQDGENYQRTNGIPVVPGYAIKFGSDIAKRENYDEKFVKEVFKKYGINRRYIMAVGSIEIRKNHETLYNAYLELLKEKDELPQMLFCGYPGWKTEEFRSIFERDERVRNKIMIITPDDKELDVLYNNCDFTVLASLYEGWSLTLPESLNYGKFCLTSNVAPLREIAGSFVDYVEPYDVKTWAKKIVYYYNHMDELKRREKNIKDNWKAVSWRECADMVAKKLESILE